MYLARIRVSRFLHSSMPRPIGLTVVCFLCSISGCEQSCAEIGIQAKNGTLLEHENLKEDRTQAKTSRYTINKVLYSVPCAYAREVFLLNLCFGPARMRALNLF